MKIFLKFLAGGTATVMSLSVRWSFDESVQGMDQPELIPDFWPPRFCYRGFENFAFFESGFLL